jgi:hypothetical protein
MTHTEVEVAIFRLMILGEVGMIDRHWTRGTATVEGGCTTIGSRRTPEGIPVAYQSYIPGDIGGTVIPIGLTMQRNLIPGEMTMIPAETFNRDRHIVPGPLLNLTL